MSPLTPRIELGQVATCSKCGARSEPAYSSRPRDPDEHRGVHRALLMDWRNGGRPETMAVVVLPTVCPACGRAELGRPRELAPETAQETFARLASEFERQTGVWAPGHRRPGDIDDDGLTEVQRSERFRAWLARRFGDQTGSPAPAPAAAPPPQPASPSPSKSQGQLALFEVPMQVSTDPRALHVAPSNQPARAGEPAAVKVVTVGLEDLRAVFREVLVEMLAGAATASPAPPGPELLTTEQAAAELQVQPATVADWIRSGRLRATRPGGRQYRISREDLEAAKRGPRSDVDVTSEVRRISALLHRTRR